MEHYVTLFDGNFLPQGLALHESMQQHAGVFTLWVLCMDATAKTALDALALPNLRSIALQEVEVQFPELLSVKPTRSRVEYCWTLTPFTPLLVFDRDPAAQRATYVDADMCLLGDPSPLFVELEQSAKSVQITDHAYDPVYDQSDVSGRYCVQFVTFVRDRGEPVRRWWQARCLEWCYARVEPNRFGDQKYLDDWPVRFAADVHVSSRIEAFMAPWNACRFPAAGALLWHFHGLRLLESERVLLHDGYQIPADVERRIYRPYVVSLRRQLARLGHPVVQGRRGAMWLEWFKLLVRVLRDGPVALRRRARFLSLRVMP